MTIPALAAIAALLFLLSAFADVLGFASTLAIIHDTGTVCGVPAGTSPAGIQCARGSRNFPVLPNASFASVSGGRDFFCGLRSGGNSFFLWNTGGNSSSPGTGLLRPKRLYIKLLWKIGEAQRPSQEMWTAVLSGSSSTSSVSSSATSSSGVRCRNQVVVKRVEVTDEMEDVVWVQSRLEGLRRTSMWCT